VGALGGVGNSGVDSSALQTGLLSGDSRERQDRKYRPLNTDAVSFGEVLRWDASANKASADAMKGLPALPTVASESPPVVTAAAEPLHEPVTRRTAKQAIHHSRHRLGATLLVPVEPLETTTVPFETTVVPSP
jgi:hypothetical protein